MKKLIQTKTALIFSCFTCLLLTAACSGEGEPAMMTQEEVTPERPNNAEPYTYVEQMPEFKGGETAMLNFLGSNIKYPKAAQDASVEGLTVLSFVVETDGSVTNIQTVKSLSPETDQEAMRVVKLMSGDWTPGKQDGVPLRVKYTLPIRFALKNPADTSTEQSGKHALFQGKAIYKENQLDVKSTFKAGTEGMLKFFAKNIHYPNVQAEGLVKLTFTVKEDGSFHSYFMEPANKALQDEVLRALQLSEGMWQPGKIAGKSVPAEHTISVKFKMDDGSQNTLAQTNEPVDIVVTKYN